MGLELGTTLKIYRNSFYLWFRKKKIWVLRQFNRAVWNSRRGFFSLIIIGLLLFALGPGSGMTIIRDSVQEMDFLQASQTIQVKPGDTVIIPWDTKMDEGYFTGGASAPFIINATFDYPDGMNDPPDKPLASVTLSPNQVYGGSFEFKVPDSPGKYEITVQEFLKIRPGQEYWTSSGKFTVTLLAVASPADNSTNNNSTNNTPPNNNTTVKDNGDLELPKQSITGGLMTSLMIGIIVVLCVVLYYFWPRKKGSVQKTNKSLKKVRR
jgi:hypothetical protein